MKLSIHTFDGTTLIYLHCSQGYDSQCGNSSTFRGSLELSHNSVSSEPHEYATLGVPPPQPVVNLNSSDGMATAIPSSMAMAPMARGESVSSSTSTNASNNYTQYHHTTSDKPKKRVTIMESNNSESCV